MRPLTAATLLLSAGSVVAETRSITADVWVDNWFQMYVDGNRMIEDSVPITTERSFNAETVTFGAELPTTVAILAKDFKQNDTGLEYIGTRRQQMGDGGMIAQFRDASTGAVLGVTDGTMRCLVIHRAPLDRRCAEEREPLAGQGACAFDETAVPEGWTEPVFDDSAWSPAVEHSEREVGPKDGYDRIDWNASARLVWSADLVQDNTVLCRLTIDG